MDRNKLILNQTLVKKIQGELPQESKKTGLLSLWFFEEEGRGDNIGKFFTAD